MKGVLYLVPNTLGNPDTSLTIPPVITEKVSSIRVYIVENLRNARRYLKQLNRKIDIDQLTFYELNEHTPPEVIPEYLEEARNGEDTAIITEAGVPGVADPGATVVQLAHEQGIKVVPLTGPSSILMALMASGMNGQSFSFLGYLPINRPDRMQRIRQIEQEVRKNGTTQIFIEAPYRNDALLKDLLEVCDPYTRLCIAVDITMESELIRTMNVKRWRSQPPALHKRPVIFLLGRGS
jgi:16S rRNA (cytidine1402-2'-O)-methyltransferase